MNTNRAFTTTIAIAVTTIETHRERELTMGNRIREREMNRGKHGGAAPWGHQRRWRRTRSQREEKDERKRVFERRAWHQTRRHSKQPRGDGALGFFGERKKRTDEGNEFCEWNVNWASLLTQFLSYLFNISFFHCKLWRSKPPLYY